MRSHGPLPLNPCSGRMHGVRACRTELRRPRCRTPQRRTTKRWRLTRKHGALGTAAAWWWFTSRPSPSRQCCWWWGSARSGASRPWSTLSAPARWSCSGGAAPQLGRRGGGPQLAAGAGAAPGAVNRRATQRGHLHSAPRDPGRRRPAAQVDVLFQPLAAAVGDRARRKQPAVHSHREDIFHVGRRAARVHGS